MRASIIIPAFNAEPYVRSAIESALQQSLSDLEVLVVDDRSNDGTAEVVSQLSRRDSRVRLLRHAGTLGVSAARNTALEVAAGEWLAVLDADDIFHPQRLERLIAQAELRRLDAIADNLSLINYEDGKDLGLAFPTEWLATGRLLDLNYLLDHDWPGKHDGRGLGFLKPVIRHSFISERAVRYDSSVTAGEDFLLMADLILASARVGLTTEALYRYSARAGSVSTHRKATLSIVRANRLLSSRFQPLHGTRPDFEERGRAWMYQSLVGHLKERKWIGAITCAFHLSPSYIVRRIFRAAVKRAGWRPSPL